jgi:predicted ATP-dependent serine protease
MLPTFLPNITLIYGPSASGKTTLCLQQAAKTKGKVIFIDTENTFNPERLLEINPDYNLDNLILFSAKRYSEQFTAVKNLKKIKNISLVIIDSFTHYYRLKQQAGIVITPPTIRQLQFLKSLEVPILLTSQVYSTQDNQIKPLASHLWKNFAKQTIKLEKEPKRLLKTKYKQISFKITSKGLEKV